MEHVKSSKGKSSRNGRRPERDSVSSSFHVDRRSLFSSSWNGSTKVEERKGGERAAEHNNYSTAFRRPASIIDKRNFRYRFVY